jgi:hypothetical protein
MLLGQDQVLEADDDICPIPLEDPPLITEEVVVSLHATHSKHSLSTLRFKGAIGKVPVCALVDRGSTHSFVDPIVL